MTQTDFLLKHSILARLDAAIEQFEESVNELSNTLPDGSMRKSKFVLMQTRREILNVREAAVTTLTRLNTFGATLDTMAQPEAGVDTIIEDVLRWFLLLSECDRAYISLYNADKKEFVIAVHKNWNDDDLREEERTISKTVLQKVRHSRDIFSSSNMDMASEQYQKGGSWRIPLRTVMGIPLVWNDQLIGVFYGDRKITSGTVAQDMLPLFKLYAAQATIAIRNAQLFAKLSSNE